MKWLSLICALILSCSLQVSWAAGLSCDVTQNGEKVQKGIDEIQGLQAEIALPLKSGGAEISLAPNGLLYILQDNDRHLRTAFSGFAGGGVFGLGARISQTGSEIHCALTPKHSFYPATRTGSQVTCFIDELKYVNSSQVSSNRMLKATGVVGNRPIEIKFGNEKYSYEMFFDLSDRLNGFSLKLKNTETGVESSAKGSSELFAKVVLLAQTEGERSTQATVLRLACVFNNNPDDY